jgi:hypothetical protein
VNTTEFGTTSFDCLRGARSGDMYAAVPGTMPPIVAAMLSIGELEGLARSFEDLFSQFTLDHWENLSCRRTLRKVQPLRHRWTLRFPDPEGRESATPFPCWLCVHL